MRKDEIICELENIMRDHLVSEGFELVELVYRFEGRFMVLRLLADRPEGGITIEDCARLNIEISSILDEKNIIQERYLLEVSSPGLDRPLKSKNDFIRSLNRRVKFFLSVPVCGKIEIDGKVTQVNEQSVSVDATGTIADIDLSIINKAKQIIE
jgi:ribosome maturation factor RimP